MMPVTRRGFIAAVPALVAVPFLVAPAVREVPLMFGGVPFNPYCVGAATGVIYYTTDRRTLGAYRSLLGSDRRYLS